MEEWPEIESSNSAGTDLHGLYVNTGLPSGSAPTQSALKQQPLVTVLGDSQTPAMHMQQNFSPISHNSTSSSSGYEEQQNVLLNSSLEMDTFSPQPTSTPSSSHQTQLDERTATAVPAQHQHHQQPHQNLSSFMYSPQNMAMNSSAFYQCGTCAPPLPPLQPANGAAFAMSAPAPAILIILHRIMVM